MLRAADRAQQGFFDASWCGDLLPSESIYSLLREHGHRIVCDEDFADCYAERAGRPSIPPSLLAKLLLLAYRDGLSDERAMEALRFDLRFKVALDLPIDHPGFHPTSLVRFRARLLLHGKERLVFERSLSLARELGLIEGQTEQILDSTPMLGAAAVKDTISLVRSGVRKLLDAVGSADALAAGELEQALRFDYARPRQRPAGNWQDKASREALLGEVARDAERALQAVGEGDGLSEDGAIARAAALLREIVGQEFEVREEALPRVRGARRRRQVLSAEDPEMRHGRKSAAKPFTGYKLHAAAATEVGLLTSISVGRANEHDGEHAPALVDLEPPQQRPKRVIGDTAYGNAGCREALKARSVEVLAPVDTTSPKDGVLAKDAFAIDLDRGTVTCPRGETARMQRLDPKGERLVRFSPAVCGRCPLKPSCAPGRGGRAIRISRREDLRQEALRTLRDPGEREHLYRVRPRIERLLGLIAYRYHGRRTRYRGTRKATFQAAWTAVLVNLHPIGAALRAEAG